MTTETDWVEKVGDPAYASITEMVAALDCDYDRLEELRDERDDYEPPCCCGAAEHTPDTCSPNCGCPECWDNWTPEQRKAKWADQNPDDAEELAELEKAAGDCEDQDDARQRIEEDALSVEVRSAWVTPGTDMTPEDFAILLATGGPAVRIRGELDGHGEPSRAWLEVQDWGKPWTEYYPADSDILLTYARCFCFGQ